MEENSEQRRKGIIIGVVVLALVVLVGVWYFAMYKPEQEAKEKARLEQVAKVAAEKKRKELAAKKKVDYEKSIKDADTEFEQENWEAAQSLYSKASSLLPDQQYPKDQLALVNAKLEEIAALEAKKEAGIVETVSSPSGRFYLIVSSSIDGDLAMDYASKLAKEGKNVKLIEPDDTNKFFHRVSVGDYGSWNEAETASASATSYEEAVWVLKY